MPGRRRRTAGAPCGPSEPRAPRFLEAAGGGADQDVGRSVAVDVAGPGDRHQVLARLLAGDLQQERATGPGAHLRGARVEPGDIGPRRADQHLGELVAVDVARRGHALPEPVAGGRAEDLEEPPAARARDDHQRAGVGAAAVVEGRADGAIARAVAVQVPEAGHVVAELVEARPLHGREQLAIQAREQLDAPGVGAAAVVEGRADGHIGNPVAIDVADPGHRLRVALPGRGACAAPERAPVAAGQRAHGAEAPTLERGAGEQVGDAVAVEVAGSADVEAEPIVAFARERPEQRACPARPETTCSAPAPPPLR